MGSSLHLLGDRVYNEVSVRQIQLIYCFVGLAGLRKLGSGAAGLFSWGDAEQEFSSRPRLQ